MKHALAKHVMQRLVGVALLLAAASAVEAQRPIPRAVVDSGTLSFDGHASVGDFVGTTRTVTGEITGAAELTEVRGWVETPVKTLKTGNDHRDRDMNKSMESDQYPAIHFDLEGVTVGAETGDSATINLHGTFKIHGVARVVDLPATVAFLPQGFRLRSDFPLNLKDYHIGGLTKFLGVLKMYPDIQVHIDLWFRSEPAAVN